MGQRLVWTVRLCRRTLILVTSWISTLCHLCVLRGEKSGLDHRGKTGAPTLLLSHDHARYDRGQLLE